MMIKRNRGRNWLDWQRRSMRTLQFVAFGVCLMLIGSLIFGEMGLPRYLSMRNHAQELEQNLRELTRTNAALRVDIDGLQHDPAKVETLAREQLGYVRKGETVYQLIPRPQPAKPKP